MAVRDQNEARRLLREWVAGHARKKSTLEFRDDTALVEQRVISSLQLVELTLFLDDLRGTPIDMDSVPTGTGAFNSIDTIVESFFADLPLGG